MRYLTRIVVALVVSLGLVAAPAPVAQARGHQVGYDKYSLTVDGQRVLLWSGEFHYFRLPSPELWRDVLEKIRAAGFNGVSLYFHWGYHSPAPGVYDFTGVRDVERLLRMTEELGLYVVARPGPYINAETTGGGFPAWLKTVEGRARSSDPGYTAAYRDWLGRINPILARHQVTRGGSVIAYNVENEYAVNVDTVYMRELQEKARADGIDVPIVHNNCCGGNLANWSSGEGAVQIPGVDDYPQAFNCDDPATWGTWGEGVTRRLRDDAPVYAAEYQAGAIDLNNAGYDKCRELTGPDYMKVYYKSNIIGSGATMYGYYMIHGGTSWGWLPQPNDVYTSYDYGAAITESRGLTTKYDEFKRQGYFLNTVKPLAKTDAAPAPRSSDPAVFTQARSNPDTGTQFVLLRHADRRSSADATATLDWATPDGEYSVPVRVNGRDAKILVAGYDLGGQRLVWSSSEILTHVGVDGRDVAVLYGRDGEQGSTVLRYSSEPVVKVLDGDVKSSFDGKDLRLDYTHSGLARVLISGGGRPPMLLMLGTDETVAQFWRLDTAVGPVLVRGTSIAREAEVAGDWMVLKADTDRAGEVELFAPVRRLVIGGKLVVTRRTPSGSLLGRLPGPRPVTLPALTNWQYRGEPPAFGNSGWQLADKTTTASPIKPKTLPVLYADEYGYHYGNVWYRGSFTASGDEKTVSLNAITGKRGNYLVWLNGTYLGSALGGTQADSEPPVNQDPGRGDFAVPPGLLSKGEPATLAVLVTNMGHNDDWTADDTRFKQPRGLFGASVDGAQITWHIRGARGSDPERGPLNAGGLYGERDGWHLPGGPGRWGSSPPATVPPGVSWYRTTFRLDLPQDQDVPVALRLSAGDYRVFVFVNGWNMGQYVNPSPQRDFVLPAGVLGRSNTVALAVIATEPTSLGPVSLVTLGNHWTSAAAVGQLR
ncbi:beta-galactosidase GanA [Kibdelosporangium banguiense]|uniref:beta-galactosidase n=1 Tax=Kibdelosporangium banguiense TaxID=1365924 RepID=A0ABS4TNI9_9PSEU|nr:beta-galactosidase [Kibdelosporangium banguiense]MBP2325965.1 beta-galactosidase GanA [Kibdelosporangium banguiense]